MPKPYTQRHRDPQQLRRDHELKIRLSEDEYKRLCATAASCTMRMADVVRLCLFAIGVPARTSDAPVPAARADVRRADPDLMRAVARIGSNVNQIARAANRQAVGGERLDLITLLATLIQIEQHLAALSRAATHSGKKAC